MELDAIERGNEFRAAAFPNALPHEANEDWREADKRDQSRIKCDRSHMCGEHARWALRNGPPFSYVCDYHRRVYEATGTFWKDGESK